MTNFRWKIHALNVATEGDLSQVVRSVTWRYIGEAEKASAEVSGVTMVDPADPASFTEFDALTRGQVVAWLESKEDVAAHQAAIEKQISDILNPTESLQPPFGII